MTHSLRHALIAALLLLAGLLAALPVRAAPNAIKSDLIAEGPVAPGATTTVAIRMRPDAGWHGYWLNPGDAGLGMTLDWTLPEGVSVGEPDYPVPEKLILSDLMNHVYNGEYAVLVPLTVAPDIAPGTRLPIVLNAQWLACTDEICVPEQGRMETALTIGGKAQSEAQNSGLFDEWRARLPAPLDSHARFELAGNTIRLGIPLPRSIALQDPHVFIRQDRIVSYGEPQRFTRDGDTLVVEIRRAAFEPLRPEKFSGLLRLNEEGDGLSFEAEPGTVPAGGKPIASDPATAPGALTLLLLAAIAGGLLLNVMPCVFPILSLKALSLARAGESDSHARTEGLAYAAGVIVACMALGALLLGLRAAGEQVGWAFQLQEPLVIASLLLLAAAITANFLGLFELSLPGIASAGSPQSAFATGLLAAFAATPCTGPFMAAAMGAALLLPVLPAMALFAALGLGIALPFLAIAFVPALRSRMPKPGHWMTRFRRWMSVPMGLTALALLWLASRIGGDRFALACAGLTVLLLALLWLVGQRQRAGKGPLWLATGGLAALTAASIAMLPGLVSERMDASDSILAPLPYSEDALAAARQSGKPVFAWFTADWCLTCKVNEQVAIEREDTRKAFEAADVVVLRGDWTRRDPAITRYLTAHGAAGVPLYVWYPAGGGEPQQLPQVLTPDMLRELAQP